MSVWRKMGGGVGGYALILLAAVRGELFAVRSVLGRRGSDGVHTQSARRLSLGPAKVWTFPRETRGPRQHRHSRDPGSPVRRAEHEARASGLARRCPSTFARSSVYPRAPSPGGLPRRAASYATPLTRTGAIVGSEAPVALPVAPIHLQFAQVTGRLARGGGAQGSQGSGGLLGAVSAPLGGSRRSRG